MNLIYIFVKILNLKTMESNNLNECLDYAKDSGDFEPIECAVIEQTKIIEKAIQQLLEIRKTLLSNQNPIL